MATYSNLGITLITTGDESGTWGTTTNGNFDSILDEAIAGVVTYNISSDANFTLTVVDATSSDARHAVIKFTSTTLSATRTCTFAPNDLQKTWVVINATTGGQSLTFKQGSAGATVTVPNGESAIIYSDGGGASAGAITRVLDSFTNTKITTGTLNATTLDLTNLEVTNIKAKDGTAALTIADSTGKVTVSSEFAVDNLNLSGNAITSTDTNGNIDLTPNGTGEVNITKVDIDGGTIDNVTIGGGTAAAGTFTTLGATTGNITTVNATTVDTTNVEVTNIKAKDGTAAGSIADSTGVVTLASSVLTTTDINGGTIDGTTIGGSSAAAGTFTSLTNSGNLTFSSTGQRITGDFSNATLSNRLAFQTSTTNGNTIVGAFPNGTGTNARLQLFSASDPANASTASMEANATSSLVIINADKTGTGTYLPMTFYTNGSEKLRIAADATGTYTLGGTSPRITGDMTNATIANRLAFQNNVTNANTPVNAIPNGTATGAGFRGYGASDPTNAPAVSVFQVGTTDSRISSEINGTASYTPMTFYTGGSERMRLDTSGNLGIGTASPVGRLRLAGSSANVFPNKGANLWLTDTNAATSVKNWALASDAGAYKLITGSDDLTAGELAYQATRVATSTQVAEHIFYTGASAERMRIDASGNVGIGTASPSFKFEVQQGSSSATPSLRQTPQVVLKGYGGAGTYHSGIGFSMFEHTNGYWGSGILEVDDSGSYGAAMAFYTSTGSATPTPSERMRISSGGNVGIGTTPSSNVRFDIYGRTSAAGSYTVAFRNSSATNLFYIEDHGTIFTGGAANSPYNLTTGSAANVFVDSGGALYRSTSSLRYKSDVTNATHGLADVLKLRSVTYKATNSGDTVFGGLIAEEVHDTGLTEFVAYDKEGRPDALHYGNMVALLVKAIQELSAKVAALEAK